MKRSAEDIHSLVIRTVQSMTGAADDDIGESAHSDEQDKFFDFDDVGTF